MSSTTPSMQPSVSTLYATDCGDDDLGCNSNVCSSNFFYTVLCVGVYFGASTLFIFALRLTRIGNNLMTRLGNDSYENWLKTESKATTNHDLTRRFYLDR